MSTLIVCEMSAHSRFDVTDRKRQQFFVGGTSTADLQGCVYSSRCIAIENFNNRNFSTSVITLFCGLYIFYNEK